MTEFNPNMTQRIVRGARRRIVKDWKSRLRDYSSIALAAGAAIPVTWTVIPADLKVHLPAQYVAWAVGILNAWGFVGKFVIQSPTEKDDEAR